MWNHYLEVGQISKVTSIILAGGKNLRLGRNKALEYIGDKILIERVAERLRPLTNHVLIVASQEKLKLPADCQAEVLTDVYDGKGPLSGIYTGLLASQSSQSIVVACDMPFLNTELLRYMLELSDEFDAVVPRLDDMMIEPLHAVYSRSCLSNMKERLESDRLKVHAFLNTVRVRYIERNECQRFDPELLSFFNINYPADLERAIKLAAEGR